MDLNDIQRHIDQIMNEQNNRSLPEFEGYSPFEMHNLLNFTFEVHSPISFHKAAEADYKKIPMLNQMKYYLDLIKKIGEIKLTAKGFLPTKIVKEIYDQEYLEEVIFYSHKPNVIKESDSMTVNLTRHLAELCGLTKKRNNKLSLTKTGEKLSLEDSNLFELIFKSMAEKFNLAYYDGYENENIGQIGYGFSLILLHKYGENQLPDKFYAEKYFKAFPALTSAQSLFINETPGNRESACYSLRTFDRFLNYFGMIKIEKVGEQRWMQEKFITKTELLDKLIKVKPHKFTDKRTN
jgi:hypothetical protein